jgi:hypothetical protein
MKPPIQPTEFDCAFLAGLIDGEGHIEITHGRVSGMKRSYLLQVTVGNSCIELLEWCLSRFGGFICRNSYKKNFGPKRAVVFRWRTSGPGAATALKLCLPYLVGKISHAEIAIEFQSTVGKFGQRLTEATMAKREDCWYRLRELTKTGKRLPNPNNHRVTAVRTLDSKALNRTPRAQRQPHPTLFEV